MSNLEDMFKKAIGSEQQTETQKSEQEKLSVESTQTEANRKKDDIETLLAEANKTEAERVKAIELKKQAEELIKNKTEITEEMTEFLKSADDIARAHAEKGEMLNEQIKNLSSDPAVMDMIRIEAEKFNQKRDLNKRFYSTNREIESNLYSHNTVNGKKYHEMIGGSHGGDDPQALLELYGSMSTGDWGDSKASLEDAKNSVDILERISTESKNSNPDMQKIDGEYANFLYQKLEHFRKTFDQRIEKAALGLQEYYKNYPDPNDKDKCNNLTLEEWKQKLNFNNRFSSLKYELRNVDEVMKGDGFKARKLATLGEKIKNLSFISSTMENNPFIVDEFKERD